MMYFSRVYKTGEKAEKTEKALVGRGRNPLGWNVYEEWQDESIHYIGFVDFKLLKAGKTIWSFDFEFGGIRGKRVIELGRVEA